MRPRMLGLLCLSIASCTQPSRIDAGPETDSGRDGGDAGSDTDAGVDAGETDGGMLDTDGGMDGGADAGISDAGMPIPEWRVAHGSPNSGGLGHDETFYAVARGPNGVVAAGVTLGEISAYGITTSAAPALMVVSFTETGSYRWARRFEGTDVDHGRTVIVDPVDGSVFVGGSFGGTGRFERTTGSIDASPPLTSNGTGDGVVAAFDDAGGFRWQRAIAGTRAGERDVVSGLALEPSRLRVVSVGYYHGSVELETGTTYVHSGANPIGAFVAWHDVADGTIREGIVISDSASQSKDVAIAPDGIVYVVGDHTQATSFGGPLGGDSGGLVNGFIAAFNPDGTDAGALTVSGPGDQEVERIAMHPSGDIIVGGYYNGTLALGAATAPAPSARSAWISRVRRGAPWTVVWLSTVVGGSGVTVMQDAIDVMSDGTVLASISADGAASFARVFPSVSAGMALTPTHGTSRDATLLVIGGAGGDLVRHTRIGTTGGDASMPTRIHGIEAFTETTAILAGLHFNAWGDEISPTIDPFVWHMTP